MRLNLLPYLQSSTQREESCVVVLMQYTKKGYPPFSLLPRLGPRQNHLRPDIPPPLPPSWTTDWQLLEPHSPCLFLVIKTNWSLNVHPWIRTCLWQQRYLIGNHTIQVPLQSSPPQTPLAISNDDALAAPSLLKSHHQLWRLCSHWLLSS